MIIKFKNLFLILFLLNTGISNAQTYHYYFGNIHAHSSYSDGSKDGNKTNVLTPADCFRFAKNSEHMDFLGISEHNHKKAGMLLANYKKGLEDANTVNEDGIFVCMYGMEYGVITNGGHVLIYGMDKLIGWESGNFDIYSAKFDYASLFRIIATQPNVFATLAHPAKTDYSNLYDQAYNLNADQAIYGVALSSGPAFSKKTDYTDKAPVKFYSYYKRLLSLGYIVGPTMDHDNHNTTFGRMSSTRTVILANSLNRDSIIAGYRSNRFYATEDWNTEVNFTINGQPLGSYIKNSDSLAINVQINDPDQNDSIKSIKLMYGKPGKGIMPTILKSTNDSSLNFNFSLVHGDAYYFYLEILQKDGDHIYTSPIWAKF